MIPITSFSQSISKTDTLVKITPTELKKINLIFLEHSKLLRTDSIMKLQLADYKRVVSLDDSIKRMQAECLSECNKEVELLNDKVLKYKDENKTLKKACGGVSIIALISILFNIF